MTRTQWIAAGLLALLPGPAAAHLVSTRFGELYSGMLHPLTSMPHLVPWLALALLAGLQEPRTGRWALPVFPLSVCAGVVLGDLGLTSSLVETLNLLSFIALGLAVTLNARLPVPLFLGLTILFGISHGFANGAPELHGPAAVLYTTGVALSAYLLVALVAGPALALANGPAWGCIAVRAMGSWIAAAGLIYTGLQFRIA